MVFGAAAVLADRRTQWEVRSLIAFPDARPSSSAFRLPHVAGRWGPVRSPRSLSRGCDGGAPERVETTLRRASTILGRFGRRRLRTGWCKRQRISGDPRVGDEPGLDGGRVAT